jgi:hypothetical protein
VPSGRSGEHYSNRDSLKARSQSSRPLSPRPHINRSSAQRRVHRSHPFAKNRWSASALGESRTLNRALLAREKLESKADALNEHQGRFAGHEGTYRYESRNTLARTTCEQSTDGLSPHRLNKGPLSARGFFATRAHVLTFWNGSIRAVARGTSCLRPLRCLETAVPFRCL